MEQDEVLISATHSLAVSDRAAQDILKNFPDSLSPKRKKVIQAACSLVGKDTSGNILVVHCSSSANNVVITSNSIFGFAIRPSCY